MKDPIRGISSNRKMWAMLRDISKQVRWMIDGQLQLCSEEDWKDIFSASLMRNQRMAKGVEGEAMSNRR